MNIEEELNKAFSGYVSNLEKLGILYPPKTIIKNIGIKYYLIPWRKKYFHQKELLSLINDN